MVDRTHRTPEEIARSASLNELEASPEGREKAAEHFRKLRDAAAGDGFSAVLRRAITTEIIRRNMTSIAFSTSAGVDPTAFESFRRGEGTLPSDAIDRLVEIAGLQVVSH